MSEDHEDERHRRERTDQERIALLERDVRSHARTITAFVEAGKSFSQEQVAQLRTVLREELADAGLRIDGPEHVDDAREDFRFLRRLREGTEGYAAKLGWLFIAAIAGGAIWLFTNGLNFWKGH